MGTMINTICISFLLLVVVEANNRDRFNYELYTDEQVPGGGGTSYGQRNWRSVTCDNIGLCVSTLEASYLLLSACFALKHSLV